MVIHIPSAAATFDILLSLPVTLGALLPVVAIAVLCGVAVFKALR